jgi:hypothetical protein
MSSPVGAATTVRLCGCEGSINVAAGSNLTAGYPNDVLLVEGSAIALLCDGMNFLDQITVPRLLIEEFVGR